jgi:putative ABC transport system ATP-binding protein
MINISEVEKTYYLGKSKIEALKGINASFGKGEFTSVVGPSGSGKSTLLNIIGCLDRPDKGKVMIGEEDITILKKDRLADIRAEKIGFIFQSFNLIPVLNVYENVELPLNNSNKIKSKKEKKEKILELIEQVELSKYLNHRPEELSGGQRQRIAIARALVTNPEIVLADEPTANLDSATGQVIIELMRKINRDYKTTFIFSTHDSNIMKYAERVLNLHDGQIVN